MKSRIRIDDWISFKPHFLQIGSLEVKEKNGLTKIILPSGNEQRQFFKVKDGKVTVKFEIVNVSFLKRLLI